MVDEGIAVRLMHLYRLLGGTTDERARMAIQREIDGLTVRLDRAYADADMARQAADGDQTRADAQPKRNQH